MNLTDVLLKKNSLFFLQFFSLFLLLQEVHAQQNNFPTITINEGSIERVGDSLGNVIPDFSYAGYKRSSEKIPEVPVKVFVPLQKGDATEKIQRALDYVGNLKPNSKGFRGAVLLDQGIYEVSGTLYIKNSGVVLRGSGSGEAGTTILGTGKTRKTLIKIKGRDDRHYGDTLQITNAYVPLGSHQFKINNIAALKGYEDIIIRKPLTENWIKDLGMQDFGGETDWIGWKPEDWDIWWDRNITGINGNELTIDAPLTMALNKNSGVTEVIPYNWPGRIAQIGVENLALASVYDETNPKDEQHRWIGITMENVRNAWVRQVNFRHFAGGAVWVLKSAKQVTVQDCKALEPISEIASYRRNSFYTEGQLTLFERCYAENGYHDFAVGGFGTTGPNAFVQCVSYMPHNSSGAIGSWATGILFDITKIDGQALSYKNMGQKGGGAGWAAANSVIWESSASLMECFCPPTAHNWAFGVWGQFAGNCHWKEVNSHISPRSLFYALLEKRTVKLPMDPQILSLGSEPSTSPTLEAAQELTELAEKDIVTLKDWIDQAPGRNPISTSKAGAINIEDIAAVSEAGKKNKKSGSIAIQNGWITFNGKLVTGNRIDVRWWRGSLRDRDIKRATPHITRFVPGRVGTGLTDNLAEVVAYMKERNISAIEHNYGLWYDRRMDDHQRVRRIDADTWAPFYEQPFDRSGKELAWDHLSKYDLTDYNDWYWNRLRKFAELAEPQGKILINQQYFQHNILEAGAHWSSSPWRPANNINNTGFPEPPPYAGDKRIFLAEQFYDTDHPVRRALHQQFIRKSLENFTGLSNVIQLTSKEYTGPLHFMQFWIDEVKKFKKEFDTDQLIGLSATKDVQDAILEDPNRSGVVDVIDIRYWYYKEDGSVYAPEGGKHLAPRQHARIMETGKELAEQIYRSIREYREKYPEKAVMYSTHASGRFAWAALMAGGSLAAIPRVELDKFYQTVPKMKFPENPQSQDGGAWYLENEGASYLYYVREQKDIVLDLDGHKGKYTVYTINPKTGETALKKVISGGAVRKISPGPSEKIIFILKTKT